MTKNLFYNLSPFVVFGLAFATSKCLTTNHSITAVILTAIAATIATVGIMLRLGETKYERNS